MHCEKIGKLVETMENSLRSQLEDIDMKKSNEIIDKLRNTLIIGKPNIIHSQLLQRLLEGKIERCASPEMQENKL